MAVPSSGQLGLIQDIALEVNGTTSGSNISLNALSAVAGFSAPNGMLEFYGYSSAVAPSATTNSVTSIGETSMTLNGNITSDGGSTITERGFYFGTNSASPTNNTKYTVGGTTGAYSLNRSGLSNGTTYYCWVFAKNSVGTTYGSRIQTSTLAAFVPSLAAVDSGNSNTGTRAYTSLGIPGGDSYVFRSYIYYYNPNTGSYVTREYFAYTKTSGSTTYWTVNQQFSNNIIIPGLGVMNTNSTNKWRIQMDSFTYSPHKPNVFTMNVTSVSPNSFSNQSHASSGGMVSNAYGNMYPYRVQNAPFIASSAGTTNPLWIEITFNY